MWFIMQNRWEAFRTTNLCFQQKFQSTESIITLYQAALEYYIVSTIKSAIKHWTYLSNIRSFHNVKKIY